MSVCDTSRNGRDTMLKTWKSSEIVHNLQPFLTYRIYYYCYYARNVRGRVCVSKTPRRIPFPATLSRNMHTTRIR